MKKIIYLIFIVFAFYSCEDFLTEIPKSTKPLGGTNYADAVSGKRSWPNSLADDIKVLEMLESCEKTNKGEKLNV